MNMREANELIETGAITVGHIRHCLEMAAIDATNAASVVNTQVSKHYAHVLFTSVVAGWGDDAEPAINACTPLRRTLTVRNILREFGDCVPW